MLKRLKHTSNRPLWVLSSLALVLLLVACGGTTTKNTVSTPPAGVTPTAGNGTPGNMTAYQGGNFFVISYPKNWQITTRQNKIYTFMDSSSTIQMTISVVSNAGNTKSTNSTASGALQTASTTLKNTKKVSMPSTTTVAGESWGQVAESGTESVNNQNTDVQVVVLATIHNSNAPQAGKNFIILYQAPVANFSQYNTSYFQPMLNSFKFIKSPGSGT